MASNIRTLAHARLRFFTRTCVAALAAGLLITSAPALADADGDKAPAGRKLIEHTVRPGETATALAVKYHAWTDEVISWNHLSGNARLHVGQKIEIPVVLAALPKSEKKNKKKHGVSNSSREQIRRSIVRTAQEHGVGANLALAVSWQEAGWQMHHVSSAHAIGAMQVLPSTGKWMSLYADHRLRLHKPEDNILAGVLLLKHLGDETRSTRRQIAAYYQGLGAVREHGLYDDSKQYVRNVQAIRRRLKQGFPPA
ncbi:MAG: transglycosylase SLT domain-containing protein [Nocardioides sp.]|nr:transglycosylase SLT domain-containing protein [Nocardioides sp.]